MALAVLSRAFFEPETPIEKIFCALLDTSSEDKDFFFFLVSFQLVALALTSFALRLRNRTGEL